MTINKIVGILLIGLYWLLMVPVIIGLSVSVSLYVYGRVTGNDAFDRVVADPVRRAMTDCDDLVAELNDDVDCERDPNCSFSRDELVAYNGRKEKFERYCTGGF